VDAIVLVGDDFMEKIGTQFILLLLQLGHKIVLDSVNEKNYETYCRSARVQLLNKF